MTEVGERTSGKYTVQSVARALNVLDVLAAQSESDGLSVTEIGESTGLSKSAAFAVLQTLLEAGYVADVGTGQHRRYRLGRTLTRLGDLARSQTPVREVARPTLHRLANELGLSVRLGVLQGDGVGIIDRVDVMGGLRIDLRMGDREMLHTTAIGKAILSTRADADVLKLIGRRKLHAQTSHSIVDPAGFVAHLATVREHGYAVDNEEDFDGIICIGAAIRDHAGIADAALSVTMLKAGLTAARRSQIGKALVDGAAEVSANLGFSREGDGPRLTAGGSA
ncbi:IclR family transcriptional regulator [Nakamurella lactea]|uniref:IclR family transcriptional regulator n=1 Tax=Nakamurella lactea TaxID=459515 RepID=UPI0004208AD3|nr:IclR family transcriptional regulator [Nakamurella lactea]